MRLKHIPILASLCLYALCKSDPQDRRLNDGLRQDDWHYCEDTCHAVCDPCEKHIVCKENEKKCGMGPTRIAANGLLLEKCPKDEICVSEDCFCKYNCYRIQRRHYKNN